MGYSYEKELDMYMDDDGHMIQEDMLPEDMQERLRMQRHTDLEWKIAHEEDEAERRYYEKIRNAYLAGVKEGIIKYADYQLASQYEFDCEYSDELKRECLEAFIKAGELGHMPAIEYLVSAYYDGIQEFLEPDFEKFLYWAEKGMLSKNPKLLSSLGDRYLDVYEKGYETQYKNKAIEAYQKAVELGSPYAMYSLYEMGLKGYLYEANRLVQPAIPVNAMSAEEQFLYDGTPTFIMNTKKYDKKAFEYLFKAADSGNYRYLNTLGLEYFKGRICEKNENAAFECFKKVVDEHSKPDPFDIDSLFGIQKKEIDVDDDEEDNDWGFTSFTEHIYAVYNLAYCYENGVGCEVNKEKAFELYDSVKKQSDHAKMKVAYCYENGIGVEKNTDKALKIYKTLAKKAISFNNDYMAKPFE